MSRRGIWILKRIRLFQGNQYICFFLTSSLISLSFFFSWGDEAKHGDSGFGDVATWHQGTLWIWSRSWLPKFLKCFQRSEESAKVFLSPNRIISKALTAMIYEARFASSVGPISRRNHQPYLSPLQSPFSSFSMTKHCSVIALVFIKFWVDIFLWSSATRRDL